MTQTRKMSLVESCCNIAVGFVVAMLTWEFVIEPVFNIEKSYVDNLGITTIFTVISLARSYVLRRIFNRDLT